MNQGAESHAFGTFVTTNAEVLIVGTFPTHERNRAFNFFYPNKSNAFWQIMGTIYNYTFENNEGIEAENERKEFVAKRRIGLTDMLAKAIRKKKGSGDEQLAPIELTSILSILEEFPTIKRIVLTSRSGEINALSLFKQHLMTNKIPFFYTNDTKIGKGFFEYSENKINVFVPYSPSPRVLRRFGLAVLADMYKVSLLDQHSG